jgi:hypothetical protein
LFSWNSPFGKGIAAILLQNREKHKGKKGLASGRGICYNDKIE